MKRILLSAIAMLAIAPAAMAAPLVLPEDEPLYISFLNIELVSLDNNLEIPTTDPYYSSFTQGNWGLVVIESVRIGDDSGTEHEEIDAGGTVLFADQVFSYGGQSTGQITGIFYDIQIQDAENATGGFLDLYWQEGTSLSVQTSSPTDVDLYTAGTFLARIAFSPGIVPDCTVTIHTTTGAVTDPNGVAESYGDVVVGAGGEWADDLDSNYFNNPCSGPLSSDIRFKNSFNLISGATEPWFTDPNAPGSFGFTSEDPATAHTVAVPEPTSLALFALGLVGVARSFRRRQV